MFGVRKSASHAKNDMRLHRAVVVGAKGQIVIPKEIREILDIHEGDSLMSITKYGKVISFVKTENVEEALSILTNESSY